MFAARWCIAGRARVPRLWAVGPGVTQASAGDARSCGAPGQLRMVVTHPRLGLTRGTATVCRPHECYRGTGRSPRRFVPRPACIGQTLLAWSRRRRARGPEPLVRPPSAGGGPALAFGPVSNVLWDLALRFRFRLLPSFTLVIRSLSTLEGIALSVDPDFKIFSAAYPYVMRRLLTDNCSETRAVVRDLLLTPSGSLRWQRMLSFAEVAAQASANSANVSSGLAAERRDSKLEMAIELVLSRRGAGVRRVLLEADMTVRSATAEIL
eukprot:scaffold1235_cov358-Prasinococcus_capsulatus_cf.AAC.9